MARFRLGSALILAALAVAATVAASAAQQPSPARGSAGKHLFLVPGDGDPAFALARTRARTVAGYGSFKLVEAEGDDAERLARAGADVRDDMRRVATAAGEFDPAARPPLLGKRRARPDGDGLALVQFEGPIKDAWLDRLEATGARVVIYMAQNAYLVHGDAAALTRVGELRGSDPAVRAVTAFTAADKLGPLGEGEQRVAIQSLSGDDGSAARRDVSAAGRSTGRAVSATGPFRTQHVILTADEARAAAEAPGVVSVQPDPAPELHDEAQGQILAGNITAGAGGSPLPIGPGYLAFHDGLGLGTSTFGFTVDVTDGGLDVGTTAPAHPDFREGGVPANPSRVTYVDNYTTDANARDCNGHGTIDAGIVAGFNTQTGSTFEDADGFQYGLGIAPRARVGGSKIFTCASTFSLSGTFTALATSAYNKGARVSTNSWGAAISGLYNADAQTYDMLVRDADPGAAGNQQYVEFFSAGNSGPFGTTIGSPGSAKNVITVGAAENVRGGGTDGCGVTNSGADDPRDIIDFSSRGPTADGRRKPDVMGPGTHIVSARSQTADYNGGGTCTPFFPAGNPFYALASGTSQSTPALAGMGALVREWYRINHGGGTATPSPAMTKAILANGATDMIGGDNGGGGANTNVPDVHQGWGLGNLSRTLSATQRLFRDQDTVLGTTGGSATIPVTITDSTKPTRITMAYTDTFGPTSGNAYVNDLNLEVTTTGGTFKGNIFTSGVSVTGGTADEKNNLESVYLPAGTSGSVTIQVIAANLAGDGVPGNADTTDQDFALVVSSDGFVTPSVPALRPATTTVTPGGDADADLEPGEDFTVTQDVRNAGAATANGVSATLSGAPPVAVSDGTAAYPAIAAGATQGNSDPLAATVGPALECGGRMTAVLNVTGAGGSSFDIPISASTGAPGAAATTATTEVPQAIPDATAAGVDADVAITADGLVKDVDVLINATHTWVGDLRMTLRSPSGTVVSLVNRPGGVNNSGDNFTNTVFDDEAATNISSGTPPYTGSFRPQNDQLARFEGEPLQGTWTLNVADLAAPDTGSLNGFSTLLSPAVCDFVGIPQDVAGLTAAGAVRSVRLEWADTAGATSYKVFRRNPDGSYPATPTASPTTSSHTDTGLTAGTQYCYKVLAASSAGDGPLSGEVCATATAPGGGGGGGTPTPGPGGGTGTPTPGPGGGGSANAVSLAGLKAKIRVSKQRTFTLSFPATGTPGALAIATTKKFRTKKGKPKKKLTLARSAFTPAGNVATVAVKLSRAHAAALKKAKKMKVAITAVAGTATATRTLTLLPPKAKRKR